MCDGHTSKHGQEDTIMANRPSSVLISNKHSEMTKTYNYVKESSIFSLSQRDLNIWTSQKETSTVLTRTYGHLSRHGNFGKEDATIVNYWPNSVFNSNKQTYIYWPSSVYKSYKQTDMHSEIFVFYVNKSSVVSVSSRGPHIRTTQ